MDIQSFSVKDLITTDFDTKTKWPSADKLPADFDPKKLLENGKNPGLGIKNLHNEGITGQGVIVAIIDQKLDINHPEYSDSIKSYDEHKKAKKEPVSMHGPAVASLLVGQSCGVAPGAKLIYKAVPSGKRNFSPWAEALNDIIENNKKVDTNEKVKVVSCSIGYWSGKEEPGLNEWIKTQKKAEKEGIIIIDTRGDQIDILFDGGGSQNDKDNFEKYMPALFEHDDEPSGEEIIVPSDYRTIASSYNEKKQYMYNGQGGLSWSVPYIAGIFALALQVNPDIKQEQLSEIIKETVTINEKGLKIINPKKIIKRVKETIN
ncbi:MAG: S8/S53 family peptidase [Patescibacteria group bacterium]